MNQIVKKDQHPLADKMKRDLGLSLNQVLSSELINRWCELQEKGKYDQVVAVKTAKLSQVHIENLAYYSSIEQILENIDNQVVIASARHYLGEKYTIGHMELLINSVFNFVKVGKTLDAFIMPDLCQMIIDEFGLWMTFADLKLCLRYGVMNKYGTTYDRIDSQVLFSWISHYRIERFNTSELLKKEAIRKQRLDDKGVPMPPEIKSKMEELELKLKQRENQKKEYEPTLSKQLDHLRTNHE